MNAEITNKRTEAKHVLAVKESKTFEMFDKLQGLGFEATLNCSFAHSYEKNNSYLSILIKNANDKTSQLWDLCKEFELNIVKGNNEIDTQIEVRKNINFAEFISEKTWDKYYASL
ncbi:hypothetical protein [Flavobacterium psychrophilum]|uniref:hypothetical protein n=1 Tax=Flavobacterium psychrophilum TaxID=96345 RepID=UPI001069929A|nr:hypothetical protein [Flavobacterium psychrophilum]